MPSKYEGQTIRVVTAEIRRDGRYLITQRLASSTLAGLWEFPGGKVPDGDVPQEVLRRILLDRLGVHVDVRELVMEVLHEYESYTVDMQVYRCELRDGEPQAVRVADCRWVAPAQFSAYRFPDADEATIEALLELDAEDG
jgi:8-oxo-dGTP diphosphatase